MYGLFLCSRKELFTLLFSANKIITAAEFTK
jgi:hypothetical protein